MCYMHKNTKSTCSMCSMLYMRSMRGGVPASTHEVAQLQKGGAKARTGKMAYTAVMCSISYMQGMRHMYYIQSMRSMCSMWAEP